MRIDYTNGYYEGEVNYKEEHHGKGKFIYKSGDKYIGEYRNNKMWGKGTYYFSNGTIYEGEWVDNAREGKVTNNDGSYYSGYFEDEYNVIGVVYVDVDGEMIFGEIVDGEFYEL